MRCKLYQTPMSWKMRSTPWRHGLTFTIQMGSSFIEGIQQGRFPTDAMRWRWKSVSESLGCEHMSLLVSCHVVFFNVCSVVLCDCEDWWYGNTLFVEMLVQIEDASFTMWIWELRTKPMLSNSKSESLPPRVVKISTAPTHIFLWGLRPYPRSCSQLCLSPFCCILLSMKDTLVGSLFKEPKTVVVGGYRCQSIVNFLFKVINKKSHVPTLTCPPITSKSNLQPTYLTLCWLWHLKPWFVLAALRVFWGYDQPLHFGEILGDLPWEPIAEARATRFHWKRSTWVWALDEDSTHGVWGVFVSGTMASLDEKLK